MYCLHLLLPLALLPRPSSMPLVLLGYLLSLFLHHRCVVVSCSVRLFVVLTSTLPIRSSLPPRFAHGQAVWDVHPCVCRPHGKVRWVVWLLSVCLRACANVPTTTTKKYSTCAYEGGCWVDVTQPWLAPQRLYWGNEVLNASMSAAGMPCARSGTAGGSSSIPPVS